MEPLSLPSLEPLVGSTFTLHDGEAEIPLLLVSAGALGPAGDDGAARVPFSLEFRGPVDPAYAQATVPLSHPALGRHDVFIVPIGRDADGTRYQAVFG